MTDHVIRYVVTHVDKDGVRTLIGAAQGRNTFETAAEAQGHLDSMLLNNPIEGNMLAGMLGLPLEVRPVECWPVHFDPKGRYFDTESVEQVLERLQGENASQ